jgi:hypothetical protein
MGILSVPLSWLLLEHEHWALIPQWQPARAILFVSLMAALLSAIAAMKATNFAERFLWLAAAFLMPIQHAMVGREIHYRPLLLAAALAIATAILYSIRKEAIVLAALIPFLAMPRLVDNYARIETTDVRTLADWARDNTTPPALFVFPDSRTSLEPGIFRAYSLRGLYVDWKSGGQVNYFPAFAREWWTRWQEVSNLKPEEFRNLQGADFVVTKEPIAGAAPVFENRTYSVYTTTSSPDSRQSGSRNN